MKVKTTVQLNKDEMLTLEKAQAILDAFCDAICETSDNRCYDCPLFELCNRIMKANLQDPYNEDTSIDNVYEVFGTAVERLKKNGVAD